MISEAIDTLLDADRKWMADLLPIEDYQYWLETSLNVPMQDKEDEKLSEMLVNRAELFRFTSGEDLKMDIHNLTLEAISLLSRQE